MYDRGADPPPRSCSVEEGTDTSRNGRGSRITHINEMEPAMTNPMQLAVRAAHPTLRDRLDLASAAMADRAPTHEIRQKTDAFLVNSCRHTSATRCLTSQLRRLRLHLRVQIRLRNPWITLEAVLAHAVANAVRQGSRVESQTDFQTVMAARPRLAAAWSPSRRGLLGPGELRTS